MMTLTVVNTRSVSEDPADLILTGVSRLAITGGPKTGKTALLGKLEGLPGSMGFQFLKTDDMIHLGWSEASQAISDWLTEHPGQVAIEGVAVPRALRKWLRANPTGKPVDCVIYLNYEPFEEPTPGQSSMAKSVGTVLHEIWPELEARGVRIMTFDRAFE